MPDEFSPIWIQENARAIGGAELIALVQERDRRFRRTILLRDLREIVAALVIVPIFALQAWHAANVLLAAGNALVAASGLWIFAFLLVQRRHARQPAPDLDTTTFLSETLQQYEFQERLLANAKYWYVLPPYAGLLLVSAGWLQTRVTAVTILTPGLITLFFAFIARLNETCGVRAIKRQRDNVAAIMSGRFHT